MASSRKEEGYSNGDNNTMKGETGVVENSNTTSLLIVILSLVFVAIFGCALVGGVISGDPTNGFFITIIVASALAISVAMGVSIRYIYMNRARNSGNDQYLSKENKIGTFSSSDEENQYEEEYLDRPPRNQTHDYQFPDRSPVEYQIKEIQAKSIIGEMSALSPQSYDGDSLSTFRHNIIKDHYNNGRQGFDFSRITPVELGEKVKARQDPPEGVGLATLQAAWVTRGSSQDPSAPKFSTNGEIIGDVCDRQGQPDSDRYNTNSQTNYSLRDDKSTVSAKSGWSENDVGIKNDIENTSQYDEEENTVTIAKRRKSRRSRSRSSSKSRSPSASRCAKSPSNSIANSLSSKRNKKGQKTSPLNPPSSTNSGSMNTMLASSVPPTPAASETGSFASSIFNMFGKSKKTSSEVGASDVDSSNKTTLEPNARKEMAPVGKINGGRPPMVRPPMMPPSNRKGEDSMKTIDGRIGPMPSTPGNKSTFTIPPPRPIPRTPMGSEVFSEFQSIAGSGAVSSTFDPQAHQRALEKMRKNHASIGASPIDGSAMPIYYDDDDGKESSVAPSSVVESSALSYDVFAPPGALGIVVDTTEKGCIVYSLKKSSAMQGLMNRGDLIIGLDNFDVRNMSASSLTQIMAKKSEQAERKFTLVPNNS